MTKARTNADNVTADIAGITAGTGITGGGTSGTVTITNDMATTIAAKGDLLAGTANDAYSALTVGANNLVLTADSAQATGLKWAAPDPLTTKGDLFTYSTTEDRLAVGANDTVLTADSSTATGLKWATPAAGGMTLLSTTNLSGSASVTVSSINSTYRHLYVDVSGATWGTGPQAISFAVNNMGNDVTMAAVNGNSTAVQTSNGGTNANITLGSTVHQSNGFRTAITVFDYANSDPNRVATFTNWSHTNNNYRAIGGHIGWYSGTAVNSITIAGISGYAFTAGTVKVWGVK